MMAVLYCVGGRTMRTWQEDFWVGRLYTHDSSSRPALALSTPYADSWKDLSWTVLSLGASKTSISSAGCQGESMGFMKWNRAG